MHTKEEKLNAFERLLDVMDALRERCPWNAAQTMATIRPMTEEEVYELSDAINRNNPDDIAKEIGDLAYHLVFYARIAQEKELFDIADCFNKICDKMKFRHPHVFGNEDTKGLTAKDIADNWELVKAKEKGGNKTIMSGIPDAMPAILKALSMQEKARGCGFDWEKREDVWDKVSEELAEVKEAIAEYTAAQEASAAAKADASIANLAEETSCNQNAQAAATQPDVANTNAVILPHSAETERPSEEAQAAAGAKETSCNQNAQAAEITKSAEEAQAAAHMEEEFGDLLFATINAARLYGVDPEKALNATCSKFRRRFTYLEENTIRKGLKLRDMSLAEMDAIWDEGKAKGL